ncbi:translocase of chloroplast 159, chloroplastic [Tanacetum coccineum]|uniref:Translocase of chloroplast 159, chloroplastic n=1 Tax=Tanacetum coccineum TaxID=301880 RepID=A0ABQ5GXQ4_9ASTR
MDCEYYLNRLVTENYVDGWDDPHLITLAGLRRRGVTSTAINTFARGIDLDVKQWPAAPKDDASSCYKVISKRKEVIRSCVLCRNRCCPPLEEHVDLLIVLQGYAYVVMSGGNPPPKKLKAKAAAATPGFVVHLVTWQRTPSCTPVYKLVKHLVLMLLNRAAEVEAKESDDLDFGLNIVAIGKAGVGKSATINSIFGEDKTSINAFQFATGSVKEISGVVGGVPIRVFDTPGLKSSIMEKGNDKSVLASAKKFTKKNPTDIVLYV